MKSLKELLIKECHLIFNEKMDALTKISDDITAAANNETKSTSGDKHEVSRAMMQIEQAKINKQINEVQQQYALFTKIDFTLNTAKIGLGSLVKTNHGYFFIANSLGKVTIDSQDIYVISLQSPIGNSFKELSKNNSIEFNTLKYTIEEVL